RSRGEPQERAPRRVEARGVPVRRDERLGRSRGEGQRVLERGHGRDVARVLRVDEDADRHDRVPRADPGGVERVRARVVQHVAHEVVVGQHHRGQVAPARVRQREGRAAGEVHDGKAVERVPVEAHHGLAVHRRGLAVVPEPVDPARVALQVGEYAVGLGADERVHVDVLGHGSSWADGAGGAGGRSEAHGPSSCAPRTAPRVVPVHLAADDLAFSYPGRPVLDGVGLRVAPGTRLGVVGENGTGKSTLLHVLAGDLVPSRGEVRRAGSLALVEQELAIEPGQTVGTLVAGTLAGLRAVAAELEAAARDVDHEAGDLAELTEILARAEHLAVWDADRRVDVALSRLGACRDRDRELATLSVGERYRVRLACRLAERADLLLLDEPTNHLDAGGIDFLTGELVAWRGGVIMVTHDRQLLDDVATEILDLDPSMDGRPVLYGQPGYLA